MGVTIHPLKRLSRYEILIKGNMDKVKFGRYEIKDRLGRGGMGSVYRAYDPHFRREVALKLIDKRLTHDKSFLSRFRREAQVMAKIDHPGIVPVYDYGEEGDELYLVMRLMPGGTLTQQIQNGPIPVERATEILRQIAPALDHTHRQGMVHRDLKPDNVLFDEFGTAYLADFGIVKMAGSQATLTEGNIVGTPAYMSPEQVRGNATLDGRSDIYALGVILFQMLTGTTPFQGETPLQVVMKHVTEPVPSILRINPHLPAGCETVIRRAMSKDMSRRYGSVAAMVADLDNVADLEVIPVEAVPKLEMEIAKPHRGRVPVLFFLGGALFACLLLSLGAFFLWPQGTELPLTPTIPVVVAATTSSPTIVPTATSVDAAASGLTTVPAESPALLLSPTLAPTITPTPTPIQLALDADTLPQLSVAGTLTGATQQLNQMAVSPDEQWLVAATSTGLSLYHLPDLTLVRSLDESGRALVGVAWSRDGHYLASSQVGTVIIWDTSVWTELTQLRVANVVALTWSPLDDTLLVGTSSGQISWWNLTDAAALATWNDHTTAITTLAWSPDGTRFASGSSEDFIRTRVLGEERATSIYRQDGALAVAWSPDGTTLASAGADGFLRVATIAGADSGSLFVGSPLTSVVWLDATTVAFGATDGRIRLWPTGERQVSLVLSRHAAVEQLLWLLGAGQLLSVGGRDQTVRLWDRQSGTEITTLFDFVAYQLATVIAWSPDGSRLAVGNNGGTVQVWSPLAKEMITVLGGHEASITSLAWSPDGLWLATSGLPDNSVRVWSATTGELMAEMSGHTAQVTAVAWSADSTQLVSCGFDSEMIVWDAAAGEQVRSFQVNALGQALAVSWSPDGSKIIVAGQTGLIQIRPPNPNELTITLNDHAAPVKALAWSPNGHQFASGDNGGQILVWAETVEDNGQPLLTLSGQGSVRHLAWSPDNTLLAVTLGATVRFWQVSDGTLVHTLADQHPFSGNTAWSADGLLLATVGGNGLVNIWHVSESH